MAVLLLFLILQVCDVLTTLLFLSRGVAEANPLLALAINAGSHPAAALVLAKLAGCGMAVYAWRGARVGLLRKANVFFAACVGWNLVAIAVS